MRQGVRIFLGRNSEHGLECSLQMKRALMEFRTQARERDRLIQVLLDVTADGFDQLPACGFPATALGRQRKHSRNPARLGLLRPAKERHIFAAGRLDGHDGRQYTPVEDTANTNFPSLAASRASTVSHRESSITLFISNCPDGSKFRIVLFMLAG